MTAFIANADQSQLVIIDIQTKLCNVMQADAMQTVIKNTGILMQAANALQVPMVATEQYPQALGDTAPEIAQYFGGLAPIAKTAFSACADAKFKAHCQRDKSHIILTGLETHICVLQTALDFIAQGKKVFVVEDAVISRSAANKANAIARLQLAGCVITNTESVLFEWLGTAQHEAFKALSKLIK